MSPQLTIEALISFLWGYFVQRITLWHLLYVSVQTDLLLLSSLPRSPAGTVVLSFFFPAPLLLFFFNLMWIYFQGCFASVADKVFLFCLPFCKIDPFLLTLVTANVTKRTVMIPVLIKVVLKLCAAVWSKSYSSRKKHGWGLKPACTAQ